MSAAPASRRAAFVARSQRILLAVSGTAVAFGAIFAGSAPGASALVYGICGLIGGAPGLGLARKLEGSRMHLVYPPLLAAGTVTYTVFLVLRTGADAANISLGFVALAGAILALPGLAGTIALLVTVHSNRATA
ncbi:hypothetical protein HLB23_28540 [Nocardia uniformis]|uniref:Uncharacterized protein n=1 Tax=Nocardia uniformis TaxID=53432 RepID=A0A849C7K4_9NOCA|nr:hypothetical protein [Nocardia uniformis]NNH73756.1 hypothetical protein [Nocardia uniformis]